MLEAAIEGARLTFSPGPILGMLAILPLSLLSGAMPGGGIPISIVLLGFAGVGVLPAEVAITMVAFHSAATDVTQPVPAILFGVPGARSAQATILDGYPMARQGRAGIALGATYVTTLVGGVFGAIILLVLLPVARELLLFLGSAEFFLFAVLGVMAVGIVSSGAYIKGILTAVFGFALSMIGYSQLGNVVRVDFGIAWLWEGIQLVPLIIGLFAIPEAIDLVVGDQPIAGEHAEELRKGGRRQILQGMREAFNHKWLMIRSSAIGTVVGMLPALGGSVGHWVAYAQARATEKGGKETFGKGDIRGVIASDAANNSSDGGQFLPTIAFGIPGSPGMAIVMAMLILYGIVPGRDMLTEQLHVSISVVYAIALGNIVVVPILMLLGPLVVKFATIPPKMLAAPVIGVVTIIAVHNGGLFGLLTVAIFTVLGIYMKWYGWPRVPILIAIVLGPIVERYLSITVNAMGLFVFTRPQFLIILVLMLVLVLKSVRLQRSGEETKEEVGSEGSQKEEREVTQPGAQDRKTGDGTEYGAEQQSGPPRVAVWWKYLTNVERLGEFILLAFIAGFYLYIIADSRGWIGREWPFESALAPWIFVAIGFPMVILRIGQILRIGPFGRQRGGEERIMDVGFRIGDDRRAANRRLMGIVSSVALFFLGIWLFSIYVAVPLWVCGYMYWIGRASLFKSALMALFLLGLVLGYDYILFPRWPDALLYQLLFL